MADSNLVQSIPVQILQNPCWNGHQQDANYHQASMAESSMAMLLLPNTSTPPPPSNPPIPSNGLNFPNCDLVWAAQSNPAMAPPPPPPNQDSNNVNMVQVQQLVWAQPNPAMAPPPPNQDSNNVNLVQVQQPEIRSIIVMAAQPPFGSGSTPPLLNCQGSYSNHDPKETQQNPSEPQPSPNHPKNQPAEYSLPIQQIAAPPPPPILGGSRKKIVANKVANQAANLANLLPTGTVLVFQALIPSLTANGKCLVFNQYLVGFVIAFCAATCFLSSFTDSFETEGKLYYGFATRNGLCVLNYDDRTLEEEKIKKELGKYEIEIRDFVHAFGSLFVFLIFAVSSTDVLDCFFPEAKSENQYSIVIYLPLVAGTLSSFLFSIFPTKRKGFGYGGSNGRR